MNFNPNEKKKLLYNKDKEENINLRNQRNNINNYSKINDHLININYVDNNLTNNQFPNSKSFEEDSSIKFSKNIKFLNDFNNIQTKEKDNPLNLNDFKEDNELTLLNKKRNFLANKTFSQSSRKYLDSDFKQSRFDFTFYNTNIRKINAQIIKRTPDSSECEYEKGNENVEFNLSSYKIENLIMTPLVNRNRNLYLREVKDFSTITANLFSNKIIENLEKKKDLYGSKISNLVIERKNFFDLKNKPKAEIFEMTPKSKYISNDMTIGKVYLSSSYKKFNYDQLVIQNDSDIITLGPKSLKKNYELLMNSSKKKLYKKNKISNIIEVESWEYSNSEKSKELENFDIEDEKIENNLENKILDLNEEKIEINSFLNEREVLIENKNQVLNNCSNEKTNINPKNFNRVIINDKDIEIEQNFFKLDGNKSLLDKAPINESVNDGLLLNEKVEDINSMDIMNSQDDIDIDNQLEFPKENNLNENFHKNFEGNNLEQSPNDVEFLKNKNLSSFKSMKEKNFLIEGNNLNKLTNKIPKYNSFKNYMKNSPDRNSKMENYLGKISNNPSNNLDFEIIESSDNILYKSFCEEKSERSNKEVNKNEIVNVDPKMNNLEKQNTSFDKINQVNLIVKNENLNFNEFEKEINKNNDNIVYPSFYDNFKGKSEDEIMQNTEQNKDNSIVNLPKDSNSFNQALDNQATFRKIFNYFRGLPEDFLPKDNKKKNRIIDKKDPPISALNNINNNENFEISQIEINDQKVNSKEIYPESIKNIFNQENSIVNNTFQNKIESNFKDEIISIKTENSKISNGIQIQNKSPVEEIKEKINKNIKNPREDFLKGSNNLIEKIRFINNPYMDHINNENKINVSKDNEPKEEKFVVLNENQENDISNPTIQLPDKLNKENDDLKLIGNNFLDIQESDGDFENKKHEKIEVERNVNNNSNKINTDQKSLPNITEQMESRNSNVEEILESNNDIFKKMPDSSVFGKEKSLRDYRLDKTPVYPKFDDDIELNQDVNSNRIKIDKNVANKENFDSKNEEMYENQKLNKYEKDDNINQENNYKNNYTIDKLNHYDNNQKKYKPFYDNESLDDKNMGIIENKDSLNRGFYQDNIFDKYPSYKYRYNQLNFNQGNNQRIFSDINKNRENSINLDHDSMNYPSGDYNFNKNEILEVNSVNSIHNKHLHNNYDNRKSFIQNNEYNLNENKDLEINYIDSKSKKNIKKNYDNRKSFIQNNEYNLDKNKDFEINYVDSKSKKNIQNNYDNRKSFIQNNEYNLDENKCIKNDFTYSKYNKNQNYNLDNNRIVNPYNEYDINQNGDLEIVNFSTPAENKLVGKDFDNKRRFNNNKDHSIHNNEDIEINVVNSTENINIPNNFPKRRSNKNNRFINNSIRERDIEYNYENSIQQKIAQQKEIEYPKFDDIMEDDIKVKGDFKNFYYYNSIKNPSNIHDIDYNKIPNQNFVNNNKKLRKINQEFIESQQSENFKDSHLNFDYIEDDYINQNNDFDNGIDLLNKFEKYHRDFQGKKNNKKRKFFLFSNDKLRHIETKRNERLNQMSKMDLVYEYKKFDTIKISNEELAELEDTLLNVIVNHKFRQSEKDKINLIEKDIIISFFKKSSLFKNYKHFLQNIIKSKQDSIKEFLKKNNLTNLTIQQFIFLIIIILSIILTFQIMGIRISDMIYFVKNKISISKLLIILMISLFFTFTIFSLLSISEEINEEKEKHRIIARKINEIIFNYLDKIKEYKVNVSHLNHNFLIEKISKILGISKKYFSDNILPIINKNNVNYELIYYFNNDGSENYFWRLKNF